MSPTRKGAARPPKKAGRKPSKYAWAKTRDGIQFFPAQGDALAIRADNPAFGRVASMLKKPPSSARTKRILAYMSPARAVRRWLVSVPSIDRKALKVELIGTQLLLQGVPLEPELVEAVLAMMQSGREPQRLFLFLAKYRFNQAWGDGVACHHASGLADWIRSGSMALWPDGTVVAYKALRENWTDIHTGHFDNQPGRVVEMERHLVVADRQRGCSRGLHAATYQYARSFDNRGPLVALSVDPRDVISVPSGEESKFRCSRYLVVGAIGRSAQPSQAQLDQLWAAQPSVP